MLYEIERRDVFSLGIKQQIWALWCCV